MAPAIFRAPAHRSFLPLSSRSVLLILAALFTGGLLLYSQTMGFVWDEGFHLLSAQLINNGKVPYLDYCFPQTPLNAYWNAAWLRLVDSWRITHVVAALEVAAAVYLTASWVSLRFPVERWRLPCGVATFALLGWNTNVVQFGAIAQAYGIAMLLSAIAFRLTTKAAKDFSLAAAFWAGLTASAAAACTLLSAPVLPVLGVWLWLCNVNGFRPNKLWAFCAGCIPPFVPVLVLFAKAPKQTLFNVLQYQALFRRVNWNGATEHDMDVLSSWLDSTPSLLLLFCGVAAAVSLRKSWDWDRQARREFALAGYLSAALILFIATAHPTFARYFIVAMPFCAAFSAAGFYYVGSRLAGAERPGWPMAVVCALMVLSLSRDLFNDRDAVRWSSYEQIAKKVKEVTPPGGEVYADEQVYFLLHRAPPPAMEFSYSHKLSLPKDQEALYHVVSEAELNKQVMEGRYSTVENCKEDRIEEMKLPDLYPHQQDFGDCSVFWGKLKKLPAGTKEKPRS